MSIYKTWTGLIRGIHSRSMTMVMKEHGLFVAFVDYKYRIWPALSFKSTSVTPSQLVAAWFVLVHSFLWCICSVWYSCSRTSRRVWGLNQLFSAVQPHRSVVVGVFCSAFVCGAGSPVRRRHRSVKAWESDKIKAQRVKMESLPSAKLCSVLSHLPTLSLSLSHISLLLTSCDVTDQNCEDLSVNRFISACSSLIYTPWRWPEIEVRHLTCTVFLIWMTRWKVT